MAAGVCRVPIYRRRDAEHVPHTSTPDWGAAAGYDHDDDVVVDDDGDEYAVCECAVGGTAQNCVHAAARVLLFSARYFRVRDVTYTRACQLVRCVDAHDRVPCIRSGLVCYTVHHTCA